MLYSLEKKIISQNYFFYVWNVYQWKFDKFYNPRSSFAFVNFLCYLLLNLVQERLTKQIAVALTEAIQPAGVGVVIEAT